LPKLIKHGVIHLWYQSMEQWASSFITINIKSNESKKLKESQVAKGRDHRRHYYIAFALRRSLVWQ
jgi:hypothetical protein